MLIGALPNPVTVDPTMASGPGGRNYAAGNARRANKNFLAHALEKDNFVAMS
jgi:hypothetical protein